MMIESICALAVAGAIIASASATANGILIGIEQLDLLPILDPSAVGDVRIPSLHRDEIRCGNGDPCTLESE
ncbi:MAG: hypothetical protein C0471_10280 [Erythrobacter sp.]|nr:hypothetical protein [Erythrobacter sp.]